MGYGAVVKVEDSCLASFENHHFLGAFDLQRQEILLVRLPHVGDDSDGRLDDFVEPFHFSRLGYAGLDHGDVGVPVDQPQLEEPLRLFQPPGLLRCSP